MRPRPRRAFTLVEILVVVVIILAVTIIALPVLNTLNGRQVTDAARIFSGALVGARDSAIRYNSPRGIRLLADPVLTIPASGAIDAGTTQLCYNRIIPIEPAGDYSDGKVTISPQLTPNAATAQAAGFPPFYPRPEITGSGDRYPFHPSPLPGNVSVPQVLMVEESPYVGGFVVGTTGSTAQPNSPTSWYWNVRLGDKIQIGSSGRSYTIVGPCVVNPWNDLGFGRGNTELFVNVGPPGTPLPLTRQYYLDTGLPSPAIATPEFLFVVNGEDDNLDGYTDEGWDGFNNNGVALADELSEWETESWKGALGKIALNDMGGGSATPSSAWALESTAIGGTADLPYIIKRRPVPSPGAREVMLPAGMVIDATTWNSTRERSRIPVHGGSLQCDIMVNPSGLYIPTTEYSSPTSASTLPFLHFWLTSVDDVHPIGTLKTAAGVPIVAATAAQPYLLPMSSDTPGYPAIAGSPVLKGDRRLVTMFAQSGLVTTSTIETIPSPNAYQPGEGFSVADVGNPFKKAQQGQREAR